MIDACDIILYNPHGIPKVIAYKSHFMWDHLGLENLHSLFKNILEEIELEFLSISDSKSHASIMKKKINSLDQCIPCTYSVKYSDWDLGHKYVSYFSVVYSLLKRVRRSTDSMREI